MQFKNKLDLKTLMYKVLECSLHLYSLLLNFYSVEFVATARIIISHRGEMQVIMSHRQGSKWDGMKQYAIPGLPLAGTGIVIISWLGLE